MKKIFSLIFPALMVLLLCIFLGGCGGSTANDVEQKEEETITRGLISMTDEEQASEDIYREYKAKYGFDSSGQNRETIEFNSVTELLTALESGRIDYMYLPVSAAKYYAAQNPKIKACLYPIYIYSFRMATKKEDTELCTRLDAALEALENDGTLALLREKYIDEMSTDKVTLPHFDNAETIRVVTTGDYPPFDYVSADGTPTGYNIALLSAISEELKINVEVVLSDTAARLVNLTGGRVDVIFWLCDGSTYDSSIGQDVFTDVNVTRPYYSAYDTLVYTDTPLEDILRSAGLLIQGEK